MTSYDAPWQKSRPAGGVRPPILIILDMNGVLIVRGTRRDDGVLRNHVNEFMSTLFEELADKVQVAVWSSMMAHNLHPLVKKAFGDWADHLQFVWDHEYCEKLHVSHMHKPLLRKDLIWLTESQWSAHVPDRVILVDDDPIKCTENPRGTAVHPISFKGVAASGEYEAANDEELLRLAAYIRAIANSGVPSVRSYIIKHPYEQFSHRDGEAAQDATEWQPAKRRKVAESPFWVGEPVEGYWPEEDVWFPACVTKLLADGMITITWDSDGTESDVSRDYIRRPPPKNPWKRIESRSQPGHYYYYNSDTGQSQLEPPPPWEIIERYGQPGEVVYRNADTGAESYEKPELSD